MKRYRASQTNDPCRNNSKSANVFDMNVPVGGDVLIGREGTTMRAVQIDSYGGIDVLTVRDVPRPTPGPDEVLVQVKAAGMVVSEAALRSGAGQKIFPL